MSKTTLRKQQTLLKHDLEKLKRMLAHTAHSMRGQAQNMFSESLENAKDKSADMQDNLKEYVHEKPIKALGIAMLSGLIMGLAMHRKRKKHYHR
jgi:ElaB/YqjD/DUF883 family membrane-anchored ribosome-binding protein